MEDDIYMKNSTDLSVNLTDRKLKDIDGHELYQELVIFKYLVTVSFFNLL